MTYRLANTQIRRGRAAGGAGRHCRGVPPRIALDDALRPAAAMIFKIDMIAEIYIIDLP